MKTNWDEKRKIEGLKIRHFYDESKLIATLVTGKGGDNKITYGISVVNDCDNGSKEMGRSIAYGRYLKAKETGENFEPFRRENNSLFNCTSKFIIGKWGNTDIEEIKRLISIYHREKIYETKR